MNYQIKLLVDACAKLDLSSELSDSYFYNSLSLCVIDAVFSMGVRYQSTKNVVDRYCNYFNVEKYRADRKTKPSKEVQESLQELITRIESKGFEEFSQNILENKQRTSSRSGILKTEAVYRFSITLQNAGIFFLQDLGDQTIFNTLKKEISKIPGQRSGISFSYFLMLSGDEKFVKPDRMISRFIENVIGKNNLSPQEEADLIRGTARALQNTCKHITPRLLDHIIWNHQRSL